MLNNYEDWKKEYRKDKRSVWIRVTLSDNSEFFFKFQTKAQYEEWYQIKDICLSKNLIVTKIKLQYKSNCVEHNISSDLDGVYLIRSMVGVIGGDSIQTVTIGEINKEVVYKTVYSTPDLRPKDNYTDSIDNCFKEGVLIWKKEI